jgi:hypothetical protein
MDVTQIQDIGGCRAVVSTVRGVRRLQKLFVEYPTSNEFVDCDDYIATPQSDGYRSVHIVYRYFNHQRPLYNRLLLEIQLRSTLQHVWATAVETVDTFEHDALKLKRGDKQWERFFALMGTALAIREKTPPVPGTPYQRSALRKELRDLARALEVRRKLMSYRSTLQVVRKGQLRHAHSFLMSLQPQDGQESYSLGITGFRKDQGELATQAYSAAEEAFQGTPGAHVVLVSVQSLQKLPRAYPNYYLDTSRFLHLLSEAMR